jgi:DNA-binding protein H-NS
MNNLVDIQSQIAKLQKQELQIKTKEFAKTVQDIQATMRAFGITVKDLQSAKSTRRAAASDTAAKKPRKAANKLVGSKVAAKYRNAEGQTWTGRGLMPRWLKALVTEGRTKEEFLVG